MLECSLAWVLVAVVLVLHSILVPSPGTTEYCTDDNNRFYAAPIQKFPPVADSAWLELCVCKMYERYIL